MPLPENYMERCLELALRGTRKVAPNPLVGSVIVYDNRIIGEGFHAYYGSPHAEVEAIRSVSDPELLKQSALYVNLEPCNHFGKTPPCSDLIIEKRIPEVYIAHQDPFSEVNGAGINKLKNAKVKVHTGLLEQKAKFLNRRFLTYLKEKRPYIILKWAVSSDGFTGISGKNVRISNDKTSLLAHQWRAEEQAILVGANTIIADDPELNVRMWPGENPLRIILDKRGNLPAGRKVFNGSQPTLVFTGNADFYIPGIDTSIIPKEKPFLQTMLSQLFDMGIQSLLVEGGSATHKLFIQDALWDEVRIFESDIMLHQGIRAPQLPEGRTVLLEAGNNRVKVIYKA